MELENVVSLSFDNFLDDKSGSTENKNSKDEASKKTLRLGVGVGFPANPSDFSAMSGLLNDPSIKELVEYCWLQQLHYIEIQVVRNFKRPLYKRKFKYKAQVLHYKRMAILLSAIQGFEA
ncbi:unnamed protein product [Lathyrus oleraceus]